MFLLPQVASSVPAAIIAKKRKAIIKAFREAGATHREAAKTLSEAGLPPSLLAEVMKLRRVLVEVDDGRFYLDTQREEETANTRSVAVAVAAVVLIIILLVLWRMGKL
jgi:hypothetical protein